MKQCEDVLLSPTAFSILPTSFRVTTNPLNGEKMQILDSSSEKIPISLWHQLQEAEDRYKRRKRKKDMSQTDRRKRRIGLDWKGQKNKVEEKSVNAEPELEKVGEKVGPEAEKDEEKAVNAKPELEKVGEKVGPEAEKAERPEEEPISDELTDEQPIADRVPAPLEKVHSERNLGQFGEVLNPNSGTVWGQSDQMEPKPFKILNCGISDVKSENLSESESETGDELEIPDLSQFGSPNTMPHDPLFEEICNVPGNTFIDLSQKNLFSGLTQGEISQLTYPIIRKNVESDSESEPERKSPYCPELFKLSEWLRDAAVPLSIVRSNGTHILYVVKCDLSIKHNLSLRAAIELAKAYNLPLIIMAFPSKKKESLHHSVGLFHFQQQCRILGIQILGIQMNTGQQEEAAISIWCNLKKPKVLLLDENENDFNWDLTVPNTVLTFPNTLTRNTYNKIWRNGEELLPGIVKLEPPPRHLIEPPKMIHSICKVSSWKKLYQNCVSICKENNVKPREFSPFEAQRALKRQALQAETGSKTLEMTVKQMKSICSKFFLPFHIVADFLKKEQLIKLHKQRLY